MEPCMTKKPISELTPDEMRERLEDAEGRLATLTNRDPEVLKTWDVRTTLESLDMEAAENSALRQTLLWLVGETNPTAEVRKALAKRISGWGSLHHVMVDAAEEAEGETLAISDMVNKLCDLVSRAVNADLPERGSIGGLHETQGNGELPTGWTADADAMVDRIRSFMGDFRPKTLVLIREGR